MRKKIKLKTIKYARISNGRGDICYKTMNADSLFLKFLEEDMQIIKFKKTFIDSADYTDELIIVFKYRFKDRKEFKNKLWGILMGLSNYLEVC